MFPTCSEKQILRWIVRDSNTQPRRLQTPATNRTIRFTRMIQTNDSLHKNDSNEWFARLPDITAESKSVTGLTSFTISERRSRGDDKMSPQCKSVLIVLTDNDLLLRLQKYTVLFFGVPTNPTEGISCPEEFSVTTRVVWSDLSKKSWMVCLCSSFARHFCQLSGLSWNVFNT